jgi:glutaconate CoA-transferase subunit B
MGMLRFDPETKEMILVSVHPGLRVEDVRVNTGWDLRMADDVSETPIPTPAELDILRRFDPQGFWTS